MKRSTQQFFCFAIAAFLIVASGARGQTYYNMSGGNYSEDFADIANVTTWPNGFGGASSTEWSGFAAGGTGTIPNGVNLTAPTTSFVTGGSGGVQRGTGNIQLLSTGTSDNSTSAAINLNLNFSGRTAGTISFDAATVFNSTGNRVSSIRLYYSLDGSSYTEISGTNLPYSATNNVAGSAAVSAALPAALNNQATVRIRFYYHNGSGGSSGSRPKISIDNISVTSTAIPSANVTIANTGTPASANINAGTTDAVLTAFNLTPDAAVDFTEVVVATSGTATTSDISNFRIFYDANGNSAIDGGEVSVSGTGIPLANPLNFTTANSHAITGQTGFSTVRRYLVVADIAASPTDGRTITASISAASNVTTTGTESGTATGNQQTIVIPASPALSAGAVSAGFGNVCINTQAVANPTFTITGSYLTSANVTVSGNAAYTFATTSGGTYSNPLNITQAGCGSVSCYSQTIYIHFTPTAVTSYNGDITVGGGGASDVTTAVTGAGVNSAPTVTTGSGSASNTTDATANGVFTSDGCTAVTAYGIEYSTTSPIVGGTLQASSNRSGNNYSASITGLSANTVYYFRAYATNGGGTGTGSESSFITYPDAPATPSGGSPTQTEFTVTWTQVSGTAPEFYEVRVFSDAAYSIPEGGIYTTAVNATSQVVTGLSSNTQYWFQVRAVNNVNQYSAWVNGPGFVTTLSGPCLAESFTSATFPPTGWTASGANRSTTAADYVTGPAGAIIDATNGNITFPAVSNPLSMTFYLGRSSNTNAKTLNVRVSTTSQSTGFTTVETYTHSNVPVSSYNQYTVDLSAYSGFGNVWVQLEKVSSTTSPWRIDDIEVFCGAAVADIDVLGNSVSIADGDVTPSATDHTQFVNTEAGLTSTRTFTIENAGGAGTINISGVAISGTVFTVTTPISDNALATGESTTFTVTFAPNAINTFTETVTITNDDPDAGEQSYTFSISGTGTASLQSVVTAVAASEANTISSIINTASITSNTHGTQVWQFRLYDGNGTADDGDGQPTIYTGLTINMGAGNTVTNWSNAIQDLEFFEGSNTTPIAGTATVGGVNIIFTPTTPISVSDGAASNTLISMRLTLKNPLPANSDGLRFVFQLQQSNVSVQSSATSSQLASFSNQVSDNTKNVIDVTGTVLQFVSPPTVANVNVNFTITVAAYDANGNRDLSSTASVTLSKTVGAGTFTVSNATSALVGGTYSWTDAQHNTAETITLTATAGGYSPPPTANILVQSAPYIMFDNFNRSANAVVGTPSSGGAGTWTEDEAGTSCSPASQIIRVESNQLELSNCNLGNTGSCGTSNTKQISFNMTGRYPTIYDNSPDVLEWYVNLGSTRDNLSGLSGGSYGIAYILGSTEQDFNSLTAQGYALIAGNSSTPDNLRLVSFNGQPSNATNVINSGVDFVGDIKVSVRVTFDPATDTWSLQVRDDGGSFQDPANMTGYPAAMTATNSAYITQNLRYAGAFWAHGASCEEIMYVDNAYIPSVPTVPEIQVTAGPVTGAVNINDGGSYDFGPVAVTGGSYTQTFTITNIGLATLLLQGSPNRVVKSGGNSGDFTVTQPAAASLAPGASTTFTVTFDPSAAGARTTTLSIDNNDGDEDPFVFTLNGEGATPPVINEFVAAHAGTDDHEFIEIFGANSTSYSYMTLVMLEGDAANKGVIEAYSVAAGTTNATGYWTTGYLTDQIENGSVTILLVMNYSGTPGQDLDTNDDGVLDVTPWTRVVDDVAIRAAGADKVYSTTLIVPNFDGTFLTPGGASRIPNGTDTDNVSDWMRNDVDGWGFPGFLGTANANEAKNTPNRINTRFNVWLGTNTTWNDVTNWTVRIPNDTTEALIPTIGTSTYPVINGIVTFNTHGLYLTSTSANITLNVGAELRNYSDFQSLSNSTSFGAGTFSFTGNFENQISGTFTIGELLINNPNSAVVLPGAVVNITDVLTLQAGTLSNSGTINLKSTATKTAFVDDFSGGNAGALVGNITIERFIPPTAGPNIFHYIGSVNTATAATRWADDMSLGVTGAPGFVTPNNCNPASPSLVFNSNYGGLFTYHETNVTDCYLSGWKVEDNAFTLSPGRGVAARINNNAVIDETGTYPNPVVDVTVNSLTKTAANTVAYSQGYNLVANPFYAPLDWAGVAADNNSGVWDGNAYVYNSASGTYTAFNFITAPLAIATNQAFFVRAADATAPSNSLSFVFNESRRTTVDNHVFYRRPALYEYGLRVDVVGNNGNSDYTLIAFDETFSNAFDNGYDASKLFNDVGVPSVFTKVGNDNQSILALPLISDSTRTIPLNLMVTASGTHTFTFGGIHDFPATTIIWLEDLKLGVWQNLRQDSTYAFGGNVNDSQDRFRLHFTAPIYLTGQNATCAGNDAAINLHHASIDWTYTIEDQQGNVVANDTGTGALTTISALAGGQYTVVLTHDTNYSVTDSITLTAAQPVSIAFTASADTVYVDSLVTFTSTSTGTTNYNWNFGDGNTETVENPTHSYTAEGTYTVTLNAGNADCQDAITFDITVILYEVTDTTDTTDTTATTGVGIVDLDESKLSVATDGRDVLIRFDFSRVEDADVVISNLVGQMLYAGKMRTQGVQRITLTENGEAQYLVISVRTASKLFIKRALVAGLD